MNQTISLAPGPAAVSGATPEATPAPVVLHVFSTFALGGPQRRFVQLVNSFGSRFHHIVRPMDGRTDAASLLDADAPSVTRGDDSASGFLQSELNKHTRLVKSSGATMD